MYAFDGADPTFSLSAAKKAGAIAITVYVVGSPGGMPHADAARVKAIRAAGMGALPNWERAADFFNHCSLAQAQGAGVEALNACKQLGFPADGSIQCAFSFDFEVPSSRFAEMGQKVDRVSAGLTKAFIPMVYAQENLIDYLVDKKHLPGKQWLMASTWGQPYTPSDRNVCMVQGHDVNGNWIKDPVLGTDINTVTDPYALRAWWPDNSPYGGNMELDPKDPVIVALKAEIEAFRQQMNGWLALIVHGDPKHPNSQDAEALHISAIEAALAKLQVGGVDAAALSKEIVNHLSIALTTKP